MNENRTVEINGVKLDIDLRQATTIENMKVSDKVKVLIKEYSDYKVYHGIIVGFDMFQKLPTIVVAYVKTDYSSTTICFVYYNNETKDVEIIKAIDNDHINIDKADVVASFQKEIDAKKGDIEELERKRKYFLDQFECYWKDAPKPEVEQPLEL